MRTLVDIGILRNNVKSEISNKLFSWIDIRNNFYDFGLNLLEDFFKYDNIGIFTNNLSDALKVRNVKRDLPIILTNINNIEEIYDLVVNDIALIIKDFDQLVEISKLNIEDELSIFLQVDIGNYEDGIKCKSFSKAYDLINENKVLNLLGIFAIINDEKYNNIDSFKCIADNYQLRSFTVGKDYNFTSDGFISKNIFSNCIRYELNVDKCFKLSKNDLFINKKISGDCYGIRIKANNIDLSKIIKLNIDGVKYKTVKANYNTLFMFGKASVKVGKKIDITDYISNNCYPNWPVVYVMNGKTYNLGLFD